AVAAVAPPPAALLGTRAVNLAALAASPAASSFAGPSPAAASAIAAGAPAPEAAGPMLSIGFRVPAAAAPAGPVLGWLEGGGGRWELGAPVVTIGRDPRGKIVLADPSVSFVHVQITRHGDELYLRDVGSSNGTWVNGQLAVVPHRLTHGDRMRVGATE